MNSTGKPNDSMMGQTGSAVASAAAKAQISADVKSPVSDKIACLTKGEGDCAFHAALGTKDAKTGQYECKDIAHERTKVAKKIIESKAGDAIYQLAVAGIECLVMGAERNPGNCIRSLRAAYQKHIGQNSHEMDVAWAQFESCLSEHKNIVDYINRHVAAEVERNPNPNRNLNTLRDKFFFCLNIQFDKANEVLEALIQSSARLSIALRNYNVVTKKDFNLNQLINDEIIKEYAAFVATPKKWLLPHELDLIARTNEIAIKLYTPDAKNGDFSLIDVYNQGANNEVEVRFDGVGHYERVTRNHALLNTATTGATPNYTVTRASKRPQLTLTTSNAASFMFNKLDGKTIIAERQFEAQALSLWKSLSEPNIADSSVDDVQAIYDLSPVPFPKDSNSAFNAIRAALENAVSIDELRRLAADCIEYNIDRFRHYPPSQQNDWNNYITKIRTSSQPADQCILLALSRVLEINICVVLPNGNAVRFPHQYNDDAKSNIVLSFNNGHYNLFITSFDFNKEILIKTLLEDSKKNLNIDTSRIISEYYFIDSYYHKLHKQIIFRGDLLDEKNYSVMLSKPSVPEYLYFVPPKRNLVPSDDSKQIEKFKLKFHISLPEMSRPKFNFGVDIAIDVLTNHEVEFKIVCANIRMSDVPSQRGKDITVYASQTPHLSLKDWKSIFEELVGEFVKNDVSPGYQPPGFNPNKMECYIANCHYITYRYEALDAPMISNNFMHDFRLDKVQQQKYTMLWEYKNASLPLPSPRDNKEIDFEQKETHCKQFINSLLALTGVSCLEKVTLYIKNEGPKKLLKNYRIVNCYRIHGNLNDVGEILKNHGVSYNKLKEKQDEYLYVHIPSIINAKNLVQFKNDVSNMNKIISFRSFLTKIKIKFGINFQETEREHKMQFRIICEDNWLIKILRGEKIAVAKAGNDHYSIFYIIQHEDIKNITQININNLENALNAIAQQADDKLTLLNREVRADIQQVNFARFKHQIEDLKIVQFEETKNNDDQSTSFAKEVRLHGDYKNIMNVLKKMNIEHKECEKDKKSFLAVNRGQIEGLDREKVRALTEALQALNNLNTNNPNPTMR